MSEIGDALAKVWPSQPKMFDSRTIVPDFPYDWTPTHDRLLGELHRDEDSRELQWMLDDVMVSFRALGELIEAKWLTYYEGSWYITDDGLIGWQRMTRRTTDVPA